MNPTPPPPTVQRWRRTSGLALAALLAAAPAAAQTTAQTEQAEVDDNTVELSAFEVSTERDVGYRAANSIAGTRTNTPIKDVPLNIQVFTKELAEDLLIKNQVDLEAYNASLVYGAADRFSDNPIQQPYQNFLFRGFRQNWGLRDGIREYDPIDSQGLARVEVVKGPAAALYGLAYPGGVMNNISKTVDFTDNFTDVRLTAGSEGDYRATIDANVSGTLGENQRLGLRFNGTYENAEDERDHSAGYVHFANLNLAWQPTATTQLSFLLERGKRAKPNGLGWFETGEDGAAGNQASIPLQVLHPEIPWTWNWANGENFDSLETEVYRGTVTQRIGENFEVMGYLQYSTRLEKAGDGWDANGSGGANSWESAGSGWDRATNTIRATYNYRDWGNKMHAYGATAVYKLDFDQMKNTFAFGANVWAEDELSRKHTPLDPAASMQVYPVQAGIDIPVPLLPPADTVPVYTGDGYHHEDNSNDYYFANWQATLFDDRLKTNLGINKTNLKTITWNNGLSPQPDNVYEASKWSPMYGAVFDLTDEVSVYLVRSTSLFPDSTKDSFGNQFSPQVGKGWEGGFKVELLDGKISGTIGYFHITQTGGSQSDPNKESRDTLRFDSLSPEQQQIEFGGIRPLGDIVAGGEQVSKGFEADLVFQPTPHWQIVTSYSHVDHEFTESAVPSTIGQTYPQAIRDRYSLLTKYSFTDGQLDGLDLGLGIFGGSKALMDYQRFNGVDVARYEPGRMQVEVFGIYRFEAFGHDAYLQLNIKNLFEEPTYAGWKATGSSSVLATERYEVPMSRLYRLTLGFEF